MRFRAKDSAIRDLIALLRANQIARITIDFKMDLVNDENNYKNYKFNKRFARIE